MARPRSEKVKELGQRLAARLSDGFYRPGERFLSNRAIAAKFDVSYQTADRLVREMVRAGLLERRAGSGTYVPGPRSAIKGVQLFFHPRAQRESSFGARLLQALTARLERDHIDWKLAWTGKAPALLPGLFPVIWESPDSLRACVREKRSALLLNDQPPLGMDSVFVDSVATDDFSGGACAAQLLQQRAGAGSGFAVLSGPKDDTRSMRRVAGFTSMLKAQVISAGGWFFENGFRTAAAVLKRKPAGVFCCNDRLAEGLLAYCGTRKITAPQVVGFDDAPVAERLNLTTIAIPWEELISGSLAVIKKRLSGDASTSSQQVFMPRPVVRGL